MKIGEYVGKILRVDLSSGKTSIEKLCRLTWLPKGP